MKALSKVLMLALISIFAVGCDSEATDAERFVGTWTLQSIGDARGDITTVFKQSVSNFQVTLNADKSDKLLVTYTAAAKAAGAKDIDNAGTYEVIETSKTLQLKNLGNTLPLTYAFTAGNEKEVTFTAQAALVNAVFGSNQYQGTVTIKATKP